MSLTKQQALGMFRSDDLIGIGMEVEALSGRERSGSPLPKSRAQRGTSQL